MLQQWQHVALSSHAPQKRVNLYVLLGIFNMLEPFQRYAVFRERLVRQYDLTLCASAHVMLL